MTEEEFIDIIRPIWILPSVKADFLNQALKTGFRKWQETQALSKSHRAKHSAILTTKRNKMTEKEFVKSKVDKINSDEVFTKEQGVDMIAEWITEYQALSLGSVVQQRELLIAYHSHFTGDDPSQETMLKINTFLEENVSD